MSCDLFKQGTLIFFYRKIFFIAANMLYDVVRFGVAERTGMYVTR